MGRLSPPQERCYIGGKLNLDRGRITYFFLASASGRSGFFEGYLLYEQQELSGEGLAVSTEKNNKSLGSIFDP
jgi:hypothetical protein